MSRQSFLLFLFFGVFLAWLIPSSWMAPSSPAQLHEASPYVREIHIEDVSWGNGIPYIILLAKHPQSEISLTGWSIKNERGERAEIGLGEKHFRLGEIGSPAPITVGTNTSVILSLGESPVGVSFLETPCSSYLQGTVPFTPQIETACPHVEESSLYEELDPTCKSLLSSLPRCTPISPEHLATVTPLCESFLRSVLTYAHCESQARESQKPPQWRIFLNRPGMIKREKGTIYLVDERDRVVDVFSYENIGSSGF